MVLKRKAAGLAERLYTGFLRLIGLKRVTEASFASIVQIRVVQTIYLVVVFLLSAGFVNALLEGSRGEFMQAVILSSRNVQTWGETIINMFAIILGTYGFYLMYSSGRPTLRRRVSDLYLVTGLMSILIAVSIAFYILRAKGF